MCEDGGRFGVTQLTRREYGEEYPTDVYDPSCQEECRLGVEGCARMGRCRLEVTPDRRSRVFSAHYDNRRSVLGALTPENQLTTVVTTAVSRGLPQNPDPISIYAGKIADSPDGGCPLWDITGEGFRVDGPHRLTLEALKVRIDRCSVRRSKKR
jgi:hypothetical protein